MRERFDKAVNIGAVSRTATIRCDLISRREVGVFPQNGRLLQHVNHLKENGEAAASRLLYQDLTV